jgi:hypothetical protein
VRNVMTLASLGASILGISRIPLPGRYAGMRRVPRNPQSSRASPLTMRFLGLTTVIGASIALPASQSGSLLPVSATVAPRVDLVMHSPARLTVTATDVARGYATLSGPLRLELSGNTPGVELDVHAAPALFSAMRIEGVNLDATLPGEGGTIAWRWAQGSGRSINVDLRFTFTLQPQLQAGTYAWPITVNGRALETGTTLIK